MLLLMMQVQILKLRQQQLASQKAKQQVQSPKLQQQRANQQQHQQQQQKSRVSLKQPLLQTHQVQQQLRLTISSRLRRRRRGLRAPAALAAASGRQQSLPQ
jgi:hypothetical protein